MSAPSAGIEIWFVICQLAVAIPPASPPSERTSGENFSSSRFWITIASPNVVEQRHEHAGAQAPLEHRALEHVAEREHHRQHRRRTR